MSKGARNRRLREFKEHVLEGLEIMYPIERRQNGSYTIHTYKYGVLDLYPKADKLLFRTDNRWIDNGIDWCCNNL